MARADVFSSYTDVAEDEMPLWSYAAMAIGYNAALATGLASLARAGRLPRALPVQDLVLLGMATHRLTRAVSKDRVTIPFRAPFAEYQGRAGTGSVRERPRGRGFRRAIGSLITCKFCTGPWVSGALVLGYAASPPLARTFASVFAVATLSDFLHHAFDRAKPPSSSPSEPRPETTKPKPRTEGAAIPTH